MQRVWRLGWRAQKQGAKAGHEGHKGWVQRIQRLHARGAKVEHKGRMQRLGAKAERQGMKGAKAGHRGLVQGVWRAQRLGIKGAKEMKIGCEGHKGWCNGYDGWMQRFVRRQPLRPTRYLVKLLLSNISKFAVWELCNLYFYRLICHSLLKPGFFANWKLSNLV